MKNEGDQLEQYVEFAPGQQCIIKGINGIYDFRNISDFLSLKMIDSWLISA